MAKEKVLSAMGKDKPSGEKKGKKLHVHEIHIKRADHGGHIIHHHMRDEDGNDAGTQTSIAPDNEAMQQNVGDAMADQPPAGEGQPPQQAAAPAAGGDSSAGGM